MPHETAFLLPERAPVLANIVYFFVYWDGICACWLFNPNDHVVFAASVAHRTTAARPPHQTYDPIVAAGEDPSRVSRKHLAQERGSVLTGAVGAGCSRRQAR